MLKVSIRHKRILSIINAYTLDSLKNLINSISPAKWNTFKSEAQQLITLIESWADPE